MSIIEAILMMSKSCCDDEKLLNYICENYYQIECELNGDEYGEPKKRDHNLCIDCDVALTIDYQKATSFCGICGLSQLNQVYVTSYIIRCNFRGESAFIRDLIILSSY